MDGAPGQLNEFTVRPYQESDSDTWDNFVMNSWNGTFLHTRRYLSYHRERFQDMSALIEEASGAPIGVFAAASDPGSHTRVVSHPGLTYGGLIHNGGLRGVAVLNALHGILQHYRDRDIQYVRYKAVPSIFHRVSVQDDIYALFRLNATRYRCDLNAVVDLQHRTARSENCGRNLKRAAKRGVSVSTGPENLPAFWSVLAEVLSSKHGTEPVHSLDEIKELSSRFPQEIACTVARLDGEVVAGSVIFRFARTCHLQYSASNAEGQAAGAGALVLENNIQSAVESGANFFSFGISTEEDGNVLNEGLYRFKNGFGAGSTVHEFFEIATGAEL